MTSVSYNQSILPVFVGAEQPEAHEGTAFLVRAGDDLFLVSAGHVLKRFDAGQIWIPVHGKLQQLSGRMCNVHSSAEEDRYDVAAVLLDSSLATDLFPEALFCPPLLRLNPQTPQTGLSNLYTFCGFPGKTVTMNHSTHRFTSHLQIYTGVGINRSRYAVIGLSHMTHIAVDLCSKVIDEAGKKVKVGPNAQRGLSGGPVLVSTDGLALSGIGKLPKLRVVGVAIEHHVGHQLLVATQIRLVRDAIFRLVPNLRESFITSNERIVPKQR